MKYHLMYHMTGTDTMMFRKDYIDKIIKLYENVDENSVFFDIVFEYIDLHF